jgi:NAD(P)-dependent dehydrogenase (short-subunit alcohol dehydrogenase family)
MDMTEQRSAALVTGAARRIGRMIALELADLGFDVAVHYGRSKDEAQAVVGEIERAGRKAVAIGADLADEDEAAALIGSAGAALGPVTVLVNNAAIFAFDRPQTADRASWDRHMAVNLRAPLVLTQALLRQLPEGVQGNVVNLVDQRVWNLTPNYTSYTISKAGLLALTRHLAIALAPRVRVNAVGPGLALAPADMTADTFERMAAALPLRDVAGPAEICRALRFLLASPAMTGQMIAVDAGAHLGWLHPKQVQGGA